MSKSKKAAKKLSKFQRTFDRLAAKKVKIEEKLVSQVAKLKKTAESKLTKTEKAMSKLETKVTKLKAKVESMPAKAHKKGNVKKPAKKTPAVAKKGE